MPAERMRMSARKLHGLPAGAIAWDTDVKGYGARMAANGSVTLFLNYMNRATGKYRRHTLGHLGELTVDAGRKLAAQMKLEVRAGNDPAEKAETPKARARHGDTLGQFATEWLDGSKQTWSDKTRYDYRRVMARNLLETEAADKRIGDVTRADLMRLVDAATDKNASTGALFFRTLNSFLSWADSRGLTEVTLPKASRAAPASKARDRVMSDDEIAALWHATDSLTPLTQSAGKLVLLTAQRTGAVQALKRDWIRQDGIHWPADAMKAGRAHWTPLSPWALEQMRPVMDRDGPVFGENTNRLNLAWRKQWRPAAGVDGTLRMHDVRRSLRTWAAKQGFGHEASEAALAHSVQRDALAAAYQHHDYREESGEVIRAWQNHVERLVA